MICVHNVPYALLHIRYVFKQQIRRLPGFSQAGQFKEESSSRIAESFSGACNAESLARKSAAEQLEVWHGAGVGFSGIFNEPLSLRVKQGVVTAVGVFVDFAVPYACKPPARVIPSRKPPMPENISTNLIKGTTPDWDVCRICEGA